MDYEKQAAAEQLFEDEIISEKQLVQIKAYRSLGIFSLHNELQFLLYLSVLLFTSGVGVLIYQNIDTIGHTILLAILLAIIGVCFYFSNKNFEGFKEHETVFKNPVYDYLVLAGTILSCIFVAYLQFQYQVFGESYELPFLATALIALSAAYYFDNRSSLTIGITSLAACIGITVTPQALLDNDFYENPALFYYGVALGIALILWSEYSEHTHLKKHFALVFLTFAQHLIGISCITGMFDSYWPIFAVIIVAASFYYYKKSMKIDSMQLFIFMLLYGYIGINVLVIKFLELLNLDDFYVFFSILTPFYFAGSIILFIYLIKQFKKKADDRR